MNAPLKRLLYTPGEPAGIGPELIVRFAQKKHDFEYVVVGDPQLLNDSAQALGLPLTVNVISADAPPSPTGNGLIHCIPVQLAQPCQAGMLNTHNAAYVLETLETAAQLCLENKADAVVTGPVQKSIINDAGMRFSGHTEFFADVSQTKKVVMMLATEGLRVALATTHLPLKDVSQAITQQSLKEVLDILIDDMQRKFGIAKPRILVCGLNPHAGENGHLGHEEIETIEPILSQYANSHAMLIGPLPADTLFTDKYLNDADAVLAMYHDQGLPVLKYKGFGQAVNITLGLPFIRTSVDHGTALDIAGKGLADLGSLTTATAYAFDLANTQRYP